jgi:3-deoxy-D-manno-octulosonic-acid transferase
VRSLYTLLFILIQPFVLLRLLWRSLRAVDYRRRMLERYGFYPRAQPALQGAEQSCIWVHAVSVGETIASVPLIRALAQDYPGVPLLVTTTTPTGAERVDTLLGDLVHHVYAPYDLPGAVKRLLARFRPRLLIIMETELWPNMIHYCHRAGVPVVLANARLSERSATGYQRVSLLCAPMLRELSVAAIQTVVEAERFYQLGLPREQGAVTGNIKFDVHLSPEDKAKAARWRQQWRAKRPIWIAASTHEGEEDIILGVHSRMLQARSDLLLILVPRHPERFTAVVENCTQQGLVTHRLSSEAIPGPGIQVIVGDTMGDLLGLFGVSDVAFVGGSLIERGGHNMLEPALWAQPVICGPHLFNFLEISRMMTAAGGLLIVDDGLALERVLERLLSDARYRQQVGQLGFGVVQSNRGALGRLRELIGQMLKG